LQQQPEWYKQFVLRCGFKLAEISDSDPAKKLEFFTKDDAIPITIDDRSVIYNGEITKENMHKIVVALLLLYLKSIEGRSPSGCILFNMPPEVMEFAENNLARQFIKKYPDNETYTINGKPITSFKQQPEEINMPSQNTRPQM